MRLGHWTVPHAGGGGAGEELVVSLGETHAVRLLILPAWFDEANKLRRLTLQVMRRLDQAGIGSVLPDLPGTNESAAPLAEQTLEGWRDAAAAAAQAFGTTHVLTIRAGALLAPQELPGWRYAPVGGERVLRAMLRARTIAAREAGQSEGVEELAANGRTEGLMLAGWQLGPRLFASLEHAEPLPAPQQSEIAQSRIGGAGLWLRAEPGDNPAQAEALAAQIIAGIA